MFEVDQNKLAEVCRRHGIRRLSLFGSVLRGNDGPDSDVDLLVEFVEGRAPGYFGLIHAEDDLAALLGRRVDLRTAPELSRYFRDRVVAEARAIYEAA